MTFVSPTRAKGFTLLELIIVIAILAILSVAVVLVINPAETLRRGRDSQRLSDLAAIKSALGLYMSDVTTVDLDAGAAGNQYCLGADNVNARITYSENIADAVCALAIAEGTDVDTGSTFGADHCLYLGTANGAVDGTGWVPVNLAAISSGSPLSNFPTDPTNTVAVPTVTASTDFVYRYACQNGVVDGVKPTPSFELNATLESTLYGTTQDLDGTDGGDNTAYLERGTSLRLMGAGTNY